MAKQEWFKTPEAKIILCCSDQFLRKNREIYGGFLEEEIHYRYGASINSPIFWNVEECKKIFHLRGKVIREGRAIVKEIVGNK